MADRNIFSRFFGTHEADSIADERFNSLEEASTNEETTITVADVVSFVSELQSYYYNDICKAQADLMTQLSVPEDRQHFLDKKIKQEQATLSQIEGILNEIQQKEVEYHSVGRKVGYTFYEEIEQEKEKEMKQKVFAIVLGLLAVNTKPELENVIRTRIEKYKTAWGISGNIHIPKRYNVVLLDEADGVEQYSFGKFMKSVISSSSNVPLTSEQMNQLSNLKFDFKDGSIKNKNGNISPEKVWVHVANASRAELDYMKKTCILENDWEAGINGKLFFDIVSGEDLEQYLKGVLQIILTKKRYAIISVVNPTEEIMHRIGPINLEGDRVEICNKMKFYFKERGKLFRKDLMTARIDRRQIPETLTLVPFHKFKEEYF